MEIIAKYFDDFTPEQIRQLAALDDLYKDWNAKINVISRKDVDSLYEKHVLHSLAITTMFDFAPGTRIMDMGCGGGFPGIPLAIFFPEVEFVLCDSIAKKLKVVDGVAQAIGLKNVSTYWGRAEQYPQRLSFDFAISRAVAPLADLWKWAQVVVKKTGINEQANGLICLKGGDLHVEIQESDTSPTLWRLSDFFDEEFFTTKSMLYVKR
jgi:16S rRNA (guanine527-N7)-methyltransferase